MGSISQKEQAEVIKDAAILTYVIQKEKEKLEEVTPVEYPEKPPKRPKPFRPHPPEEPVVPEIRQVDKNGFINEHIDSPTPLARKVVGDREYKEFYDGSINKRKLKSLQVGLIIGFACLIPLQTMVRIVFLNRSEMLSIISVIVTLIGIASIAVGVSIHFKEKGRVKQAWIKQRVIIQQQYDLEYEEAGNFRLQQLEAEYKEEINRCQQEYNEACEQYNLEIEDYQKKLEKYENETLPAYLVKEKECDKEYEGQLQEYNKDKEIWYDKKDKYIAWLKGDINFNEVTLENLYNDSGLVSKTYRELHTLMWIYEDMASSDHDIRYATELYDRQRTLNAIEHSGSRIENKLVEMNKSLQVGFSYILEGMDKQSGQLDNIGEVLLNMEGISEDIFDSVNDLHDSVNKGRGENVALQLANIYMTYNDTFRKSKRK